jgi:hypothetical protein
VMKVDSLSHQKVKSLIQKGTNRTEFATRWVSVTYIVLKVPVYSVLSSCQSLSLVLGPAGGEHHLRVRRGGGGRERR